MNDYLQFMIGAVIVGCVFFSVWRHGRANPESTGRLARRLTKMEQTVAAQGGKIKAVEQSINRLAESTATSHEINMLGAELRGEIATNRDINEKTWGAVSRLQDFFIDKAINGGRR